ncbi:hypothetical protein EDD86DRAFT_65524 [Gorgonomyces haynaldii]|nr:hypothetical protein EDD86DRAFT_65524 [Gorgonomyces haynaldii]
MDLCVECGLECKDITDRFIGESVYHMKCFNCSQCHRYIEQDGKIYKNTDPGAKLGSFWCEDCKNSKKPQPTMKKVGGIGKAFEEGGSYVAHVPQMQAQAEYCQVCKKPVTQVEKIIANSQIVHTQCFRCTQCRKLLDKAQFETKEQKPYCTGCYKKL